MAIEQRNEAISMGCCALLSKRSSKLKTSDWLRNNEASYDMSQCMKTDQFISQVNKHSKSGTNSSLIPAFNLNSKTTQDDFSGTKTTQKENSQQDLSSKNNSAIQQYSWKQESSSQKELERIQGRTFRTLQKALEESKNSVQDKKLQAQDKLFLDSQDLSTYENFFENSCFETLELENNKDILTSGETSEVLNQSQISNNDNSTLQPSSIRPYAKRGGTMHDPKCLTKKCTQQNCIQDIKQSGSKDQYLDEKAHTHTQTYSSQQFMCQDKNGQKQQDKSSQSSSASVKQKINAHSRQRPQANQPQDQEQGSQTPTMRYKQSHLGEKGTAEPLRQRNNGIGNQSITQSKGTFASLSSKHARRHTQMGDQIEAGKCRDTSNIDQIRADTNASEQVCQIHKVQEYQDQLKGNQKRDTYMFGDEAYRGMSSKGTTGRSKHQQSVNTNKDKNHTTNDSTQSKQSGKVAQHQSQQWQVNKDTGDSLPVSNVPDLSLVNVNSNQLVRELSRDKLFINTESLDHKRQTISTLHSGKTTKTTAKSTVQGAPQRQGLVLAANNLIYTQSTNKEQGLCLQNTTNLSRTSSSLQKLKSTQTQKSQFMQQFIRGVQEQKEDFMQNETGSLVSTDTSFESNKMDLQQRQDGGVVFGSPKNGSRIQGDGELNVHEQSLLNDKFSNMLEEMYNQKEMYNTLEQEDHEKEEELYNQVTRLSILESRRNFESIMNQSLANLSDMTKTQISQPQVQVKLSPMSNSKNNSLYNTYVAQDKAYQDLDHTVQQIQHEIWLQQNGISNYDVALPKGQKTDHILQQMTNQEENAQKELTFYSSLNASVINDTAHTHEIRVGKKNNVRVPFKSSADIINHAARHTEKSFQQQKSSMFRQEEGGPSKRSFYSKIMQDQLKNKYGAQDGESSFQQELEVLSEVIDRKKRHDRFVGQAKDCSPSQPFVGGIGRLHQQQHKDMGEQDETQHPLSLDNSDLFTLLYKKNRMLLKDQKSLSQSMFTKNNKADIQHQTKNCKINYEDNVLELPSVTEMVHINVY